MALPTLTLLDNFNRANENPMAGHGWAKLGRQTTLGQVAGEVWGSKTAFGSGAEDGGYWTATEFSNPAIAATLTTDINGTGGRGYTLYGCLANPTVAAEMNGYRLLLAETKEVAPKEYTWTLQRVTAGAFTTIGTPVTNVVMALGDRYALQIVGGKVIAWYKSGEGAWTVKLEASDSTYTKGFVAFGMLGNIGRIDNIEAGESVGSHEHTLSTSNGSTGAMRHEAISRTMRATQAQTPTVTRALPRTLAATQPSAITRLKSITRALAVTQASAVLLKRTIAHTFTLLQAQSWGVPEPAVTNAIVNQEGFEPDFTILGWVAQLGTFEAFASKPPKSGWIAKPTATAVTGGRYNKATYTYPVNRFNFPRAAQAAIEGVQPYAALGICVSATVRSGYFLRITALGEPGFNWMVTLERWIEGAKVVLAEVEIPQASFAARADVTFALTGRVLKGWIRLEGGSWTQVIEAADDTFTSGYNTLEFLGNNWISKNYAGGTATGTANVQHSKPQELSTTQGSAITRAPTQIARTLSITQGSAISRRTEIARTLSFGLTQVPSKIVSVARSLGVAQPSSAVVGRSAGRTLVVAQGQAISRSAATARALGATQGSAPSVGILVSRALVAATGASAAFARAIARTLRIGQPQTASEEATVESGTHDHPHTLQTAQGASAALQRALARRLTAGATVSASIAHSVTRTLAASGGATAVVGRTPAVTLRGSSSSVAGLQHGTQVAAVLSAMSSSSAHLRRAVARGLSTTTGSAAAVSFDMTEVPLPPPVNMAASSGTPQPTSEAVTPQGEASLGQSRLTSSVETTT